MLAKDIKFGIEIETHVAGTGSLQIGRYHRGVQVPWLPTGWTVERDASVVAPAGRRPAEFVSPALQGAEGLRQVKQAVETIAVYGAKVNKSCGVHITVTFDRRDGASLARLLCFLANYEDGLWAATGAPRRRDGMYCRSIKRNTERYRTTSAKVGCARRRAMRDRYHAINLTHLARGRNRVEFRLFSGSLNPTKILAWICLVLSIVEYATETTRSLPFDSRSRDERFGGREATQLVFCLCRLGWLKWKPWGYKGRTYGDSVLSECPVGQKEMIAELRRLGEKFSSEARRAS